MNFLDLAAILDALRTATGSVSKIEKDEYRVEPELELPMNFPKENELDEAPADLRTIAEAYAQALMVGVVEVGEVISWVDEQILEQHQPPYALIDASMSTNDVENLITSLRSFPGRLDHAEALRRLMFHMARALKKNRELAKPIAYYLYRMVVEEEFVSKDSKIWNPMFYFDDELALAEQGIKDTHQVHQELLDFLVESVIDS